MAVIQISKMQVRRGQTAQTGFPQLSSGELGWSIDTQELFIGNGAVTEGAPAIGNTQLITEHNINNFFLYAKEGYRYLNGEGVNSRVRTIQSKLDDVVTLNDFVDINSTTDHTSYIQSAITYASSVGKPLYIPEGEWTVTATVFIPPMLELRGAGIEKTIINNISTATTFQTRDGASVPKKFSDGNDFALSNAPANIRINGFTFISGVANANPIMQLDCISDSTIEQCEFIGDITVSIGTTTLASAINFRDNASYPANLTDNVAIKNCIFYKVNEAISSDYDISNIIISENKFKTLNRGLVFGESLTGLTSQKYGPQHVRIVNNMFDTINAQAIYAGSTSTTYSTDINSVNNYYRNVGSNSLGDTTSTQSTEVIRFNSYGNYSENDTFDRLEKINTGISYLIGPSNVKSIIDGPAAIKSRSTAVYNITGAGTNLPVFGYPRSTFLYGSTNLADANQLITVEYTINKPDISLIRRGTLEVMVSGTTATVKDTYTSSEQVEGDKLSFTASVNTAKNLVIVYLANQSVYLGNILYTYTVRQ